jgi:Tol biopolymer transport system component
LFSSCTSSKISTPSITTPSFSTPSGTTEESATAQKPAGICDKQKGNAFYYEFPPIDPAGKIAYIAQGLFLIDPANNAIEPVYPFDKLSFSTGDGELTWSPDGKMIAFSIIGNGDIQMIADFPNGQICPLIEKRGNLGTAAWSPDGNNIAVIDRDSEELLVINLSEMKAVILKDKVSQYSNLQWINDAQLAFAKRNQEEGDESLVLYNLLSEEEKVVLPHTGYADYFLFSPDELKIAYSGKRAIIILNINKGTTYSIDAENPEAWEYSAIYPKEWSKDNRKLLANGHLGGVYLYNVMDEKVLYIASSFGSCTSQAFSPDESTFLVDMISDEKGGDTPIYLFKIATENLHRLIIPYCCPMSPVWNPIPRRQK